MTYRSRSLWSYCEHWRQLVPLALLCAGSSLHAQTWTGTGSNDFWTNGTNWNLGTPPANNGTARIIFFGGPRTAPDLDADYSVESLQFSAGASSFTLNSSGNHTLTVGGLISSGDITPESPRAPQVNPQTVNLAIALSRDTLLAGVSNIYYRFTSLTLNGPINTAGFNLNFSTPSNTGVFPNVPLPIVINGAIGGNGGIVASDTPAYLNQGALTLTAANSYSGATSLNGDRQISLSGNSAALTGTNVIRLTGGSRLFVGDVASTAANLNRLNDSATVALGRGELVLTGSNNAATTHEIVGAIDLLGGSGILTLQSASTSGQVELASTGSLNRNAGSTALVRGTALGSAPGPGTTRVFLGAPPNLVGGAGAAGTHNISVVPYLVGGTSVTDSGSTLLTYGVNGLRSLDVNTEFATTISGAGTTDNVRVTASETVASSRLINSLVVAAGGGSSSSTVTLDPGATLTVGSGAILLAAGGVSGGGTLNFGVAEGVITDSSAFGSSITSAISGSGGLTLAGRRLNLEGNSTYTGKTYLNTFVELRNSNTALGASGPGNEVVFNDGGSLNLNNGVTLSKDLRGGTFGTSPTIDISAYNALSTINGSITAPEPGQLGPQGAAGVSNISLSGQMTINGEIIGARGAASTSLAINANNNGRITINGAIRNGSPTVPLNLTLFSGSRAVVLNGASTFTGATTVNNNNMLLVNGSIVGGATVSTKSGSAPDPGGQLGGDGLIDPANGSTVQNGGTISPGDPILNNGIGTLTIGSIGSENNLVALGGSTFQFQLGIGADKLIIFGGLDLAGPRISLILANAGGIAPGLYTLIDYSTALTGSFSNLVLSAPGGVQATLINNTANSSVDVQIGTIPEPGTVALLGVGVLAFAVFVRRSRRSIPVESTSQYRRSWLR